MRDWFAQFPYLSKLRDPQVLAKAISEALARADAKYGIADRFDEAKAEYVGLQLGRLVVAQSPGGGAVTAPPRPRRFYAKVTLDPNRPTPQVSNIAQSILSELDRVRGARMVLTLDIQAETADGFPEDVESVVRDNAASLRITDFGFEGE